MQKLHRILGALTAALLLSTSAAQDPPVDAAQVPSIETAEEKPAFRLVRIKTVAPVYPRKALLDGREGWVDLLLTITPDGKIEDVIVVKAEPKRVFERAAIRAAMKWRFAPPADAGITTNQTGKIRVHFRLED